MFKHVIIINLINKQEKLQLHHAVVHLLCPESLKNPEDLPQVKRCCQHWKHLSLRLGV